jgi:RNA polymerase sigma-70 factor (ECF subfamily)
LEQLDERTLIRRTGAGDETAFAELVRRHQRSVERLAARMLPDARDREEVCQDVFLRVFRRIGEFRGDSSLATWINSIAYRTCLNRLEGRDAPIPGSQLGSGAGSSPFPDGIARSGRSPEEDLDRSERQRLIERALGELRPDYRAAVTMYHLEGMTVAEVSEAMDVPEGTVKSHLYRARRQLRSLLAEATGAGGPSS